MNTQQLPKEISSLKDCYTIPLEKFVSGVYFLYKGKDMMYIGSSSNVFARVSIHFTKKLKDFDRCYFIPCDKSNLQLYENSLIKHFRPPLNGSVLRMSLKTCSDVIGRLFSLPADVTSDKGVNDEVDGSDFVTFREACLILEVTPKVLKRLIDCGDIISYRDEYSPSTHKRQFGFFRFKKRELEQAKVTLSALHLPLQNET